MGLVLSNVFIRGQIIASADTSGIAPPVVVAPVASFTKSTSLVGNLVSAIFTDTSTHSPTSWLWTFGDGVTSILQNPTHLFESVGTFNVTLAASNSAGSDTSSAQSITVLAPDLAPVASFTKSVVSGSVPLSVAFTDTSTNGPTSWLWAFGDGTTSTLQNPTHSYATAGTYNVTLTATDAVGSNTSAAQAITATIPAPVSSFDMSVAYQGNLINATFADTSTNSPTSWLWDFGDGTTSTLQNPTHLFTSVGTFTITLTATNATGSTTSTAHYVTVDAVKYLASQSMLLKTTGTHASQNNTFVDSSTNALAITRVGNVTQGAFSPFSPAGWSGSFNGTSDNVLTPTSAAFAYGNGDFTWEAWVYPTAIGTTGNNYIFTHGANLGSVQYYNDTIRIVWGGGSGVASSATGLLKNNNWYHIAVVRQASVMYLYVNGVAKSLSATANSTSLGSTNVSIGGYFSSFYWPGHISNVRFNSTAVYTAAFTPSSVPLAAITGTVLLTLQDNKFKDNSTNNFALTTTGTPKAIAVSPFATNVYSAATHGGSIYFDGAGDSLNAALGSTAFTFGAGEAFTVEGWINPSAIGARQDILYLHGDTTGYAALSPRITTSGKLGLGITELTGGWRVDDTTGVGVAVVPGMWTHFAIVRATSSASILLYVNGVQAGSYTLSSANVALKNTSVTNNNIGSYGTGVVFPFKGYMSDIRVTKSAVYNAAFAPPSAPLTAITNTQFLLSGKNANIYDATARQVVETVGNVQVSTVIKKYNAGSISFDGSGDYIKLQPSTTLALGTGDFTIEWWNYATTSTNNQVFDLYDNNSAGRLGVYFNTSRQLILFGASGATKLATTTSVALNAWTHIAIVRKTGITNVYYNGVKDPNSYTDASNYTFTAGISTIGVNASDQSTSPMNGYIEDFRITKGTAVYTANFTPPTAAL